MKVKREEEEGEELTFNTPPSVFLAAVGASVSSNDFSHDSGGSQQINHSLNISVNSQSITRSVQSTNQ